MALPPQTSRCNINVAHVNEPAQVTSNTRWLKHERNEPFPQHLGPPPEYHKQHSIQDTKLHHHLAAAGLLQSLAAVAAAVGLCLHSHLALASSCAAAVVALSAAAPGCA